MIEPDPLPPDLQAEMIAAGDRAVVALRALRMEPRNTDIQDFIRRNEPELWARFMLAISPEVRRKVELVRQASEDAPKDFKIMYAVVGPDAFAEMLREIDRKIADKEGDEFEIALLQLKALDMRRTLIGKTLDEARKLFGEAS